MKNIAILIFTILSFDAFTVCTSPISRTNNSANAVLTSTKYNNDVNTVYTKVNELAGDCITDATISTAKLINASVTKVKLATGATDFTLNAKTSAYSVVNSDELITADATSGAFTLTLPTAVGISGRRIIFKKIDSSVNAVTLDGNGSETIDGDLTTGLNFQNQSSTIISNGANWIETGPSGKTEIFSFTFGNSTSASCTSSPCAYLDQIGSRVTSVTRASAGDYTANLNRTFVKIMCSGNGHNPGINTVIHLKITCSNCSSMFFATATSAGASSDSISTIVCQGIY